MSLADLPKTPLHLSEGRRLDVSPIDMHHTQSTLSGGVVPEDETDVGLAAPLGHDRQHRRLQAVGGGGVWLAGAPQHASQPVPELRRRHRAITPSALGRRSREKGAVHRPAGGDG